MINKKLCSRLLTVAIVAIISVSVSRVTYAIDGDIYKSDNTKLGSMGNVLLHNRSAIFDLIRHLNTYTYEVDNKLYNAADVNEQFNKNPGATVETVQDVVKTILTSKGDVPVVSTFKNLKYVHIYDSMTVDKGTPLENINLPTTTELELDDETTINASITFDSGNPIYDGNTPGTYEFKCTASLPVGYTNTNNVNGYTRVSVASGVDLDKNQSYLAIVNARGLMNGADEIELAKFPNGVAIYTDLWNELRNATEIEITAITQKQLDTEVAILNTKSNAYWLLSGSLEPKDVILIATPKDITVVTGTALNDIPFPTEVPVDLANHTKINAKVIFDGGEPAYDGTSAGNYLFTGTITLPDGVTNTGNTTVFQYVSVSDSPIQ
ncbi:MAG: hypothetical protein ACI8WT_000740 [Clostridium sp.]|jgi:hypothetical protein